MQIFKTKRLTIRPLHQNDTDLFFEMMSNPNVMHPIPQDIFTRKESDAKLAEIIAPDKLIDKKLWAITKMDSNQLIGICGLLTNDDNDQEIAYRFIERYWGKGYGTEIAKGVIDYGFEQLNLDKIAADVNIENPRSAKILAKFMTPVREFFNKNDNCTDRRYIVKRVDWMEKKNKSDV